MPAVTQGLLHYRHLERIKTENLKLAKGDYDAKMVLNMKSKIEIKWWIDNIHGSTSPIRRPLPSIVIQTDASQQGWGAIMGTNGVGGRWKNDLIESHLNILEIKAILLALKTFVNNLQGSHIKIESDNSSAVAYVNHMGGIRSIEMDIIAKEIWNMAFEKDFWLTATHVPGVDNIQADELSRQFNDNKEWKLNPESFKEIVKTFGCPDIDLFASRVNTQLTKFVSWKPDPEAHETDAFTIPWNYNKFYAFPPFNLIGRTLAKAHAEGAHGIIVVPDWPTQTWYPILLRMTTNQILHLHCRKDLLLLTHAPKEQHPLWRL